MKREGGGTPAMCHVKDYRSAHPPAQRALALTGGKRLALDRRGEPERRVQEGRRPPRLLLPGRRGRRRRSRGLGARPPARRGAPAAVEVLPVARRWKRVVGASPTVPLRRLSWRSRALRPPPLRTAAAAAAAAVAARGALAAVPAGSVAVAVAGVVPQVSGVGAQGGGLEDKERAVFVPRFQAGFGFRFRKDSGTRRGGAKSANQRVFAL